MKRNCSATRSRLCKPRCEPIGKTQAAAIHAKMFKGTGNPRTLTPIIEYTLPMALSDADAYYQAGTIASALIGLSRTVANAEHNADQAKSDAGPNPEAVSNAKITAAPMSNQTTVAITRVLADNHSRREYAA